MDEIRETRKRDEPIQIRVTDRRPRYDGRNEGQGEELSEKKLPSILEEFKERTAAAENKLAEALGLLRKREAEAEESRARLSREMERRARARVESFLQDFLSIVDSLDRGLESASEAEHLVPLREGLEKVRDQFLSTLSRQGVEPMSLVGQTYDPTLAEAVATAPVPKGGKEGEVVNEIRRGYTYDGKVLRAAQVQVARERTSASTDPSPESGLNSTSSTD